MSERMSPDIFNPALTLARLGVVGGWAPGGYICRCSDCGEQFGGGDKRAAQCLPCAVTALTDRLRAYEKALEEIANEQVEVGGPPIVDIYAAGLNELSRRMKIARAALHPVQEDGDGRD